jgi:membrane fusion protein (multidrug efflux system)
MAEVVARGERDVVAPRAGYLVQQLYHENQFVAAGQPLFRMDLRDAHPDAKSDLREIHAPVAGIPSAARHGPGDRIEENDVLARIGLVDPISVNFFSRGGPNEKVTQFLSALAARPISAAAPKIELILPDGSIYPEPGGAERVIPGETTSPPAIVFPNPKHVLYPGEFVRVRCTGP